MKLAVISLGGTLLQVADGPGMAVSVAPSALLDELNPFGWARHVPHGDSREPRPPRRSPVKLPPIAPTDLEWIDLGRRRGAELGWDAVLRVRDAILQRPDVDGFVVLSGTDSLEELAYALDRCLEPERPVVLTGAMRPRDLVGYDGQANLLQALSLAADRQAAELGVLVALNDVAHAARWVIKADSVRLDAFESHPGPVAEFRNGRARFHIAGLPPLRRFAVLDEARLMALQLPIWTMTLQPCLPQGWLRQIDGLIVAGMGTGSLSQRVIDQLTPWADRFPVVVVSRCSTGHNVEATLYAGSRARYEDRGLRLRGYEGLNPLQARIQLAFELASGSVGPTPRDEPGSR